MGIIRKQLLLACLILFLGLFFTQKVNAASLANVSDTISTSRPSASAPLATAQTATTDTQVTIVSFTTPQLNNSPMFLASDSALLLADTGQTASRVNVASESAHDKPSTNQQVVYFTGQIGNTHHAGTTMIVPVTSTHTIKFTTVAGIPASGHIIIQFPTGGNIASPSATGFSFNGMTASNPTDVKYNNATCTSVTVTSSTGTIDCVLTSSVAAATTVTVLIGCTAGTTSCTTFAPRLINPTKGTSAEGTADIWQVLIKTQDNSAIDLDSGRAKIATIEAVQVQGIVEPYITFTISGVTAGSSVCGDTTTAGTSPTATFVDLGSLNSGQVNIEAQNLTVNTNASAGYAITATSSGRFINPASGFYLSDANGGNGLTANDTPVPAAIAAGTAKFGIHPCSTSGSPAPTVSSGTWGTGGGASNLYSNPWNTGTNGFYASLSSTTQPSSASITTVEYAASVTATTPTGIYSNYFTYVATAIF